MGSPRVTSRPSAPRGNSGGNTGGGGGALRPVVDMIATLEH
jgi:hypothetical protein